MKSAESFRVHHHKDENEARVKSAWLKVINERVQLG